LRAWWAELERAEDVVADLSRPPLFDWANQANTLNLDGFDTTLAGSNWRSRA
jgi:hypothetical protein